ncbi:RNA polymerase sigma factor [Elizabethkingia anophelis]|uniref:RNA polymerase sigma factor n=1 Tax=Elizabethkingia anophelis TaxID=1117645 RepID=UPI000C6CE1CC|nr:RNA polymerase sigma factor [Elizabethkingia anophelis]PKR32986.1 RNA polymerase [Elizabethkingia anophelis]PKR35490.1 RNA polymerase [Elizabethkingia anophelis]PRQ81013.1 RNA polymerase [Elizabethkingia anophelis]PRQ82625.1 RNA polymerase [Elizabethkingia anophelis]PRQ88867.1 RNA polymerase [Elizabethkingia anophelis]
MDQQTFKTTVFIHKDRLYRFAKSFLVSTDEAYDVVQEIMIKLWQMKDDLHRYENIEAFALRCLRNECLNRLKHAKVVEDYQIKSVRQEYSVNYNDNTREIIVNMINQLPEKQKMVMHLKDIEEYSIAEICEALGMESNAVRINLMRARQKIKTQLEKIFEYENRQIQTI